MAFAAQYALAVLAERFSASDRCVVLILNCVTCRSVDVEIVGPAKVTAML